MINIKKIAAITIAASLITVSLAACTAKPASESSSADTSSVTSTESSSSSEVTSDSSSSATETSSGTTSEVSSAISSAVNSTTSTNSVITSKPVTSTGGKTSSTTSTATGKADLSGIVKNLNGRTIILNMPGDMDVSPKDKHVERLAAKLSDIQKQYNCKITILNLVSESNGDHSIANSVVAGKPKVDLWWQNGFNIELLPHYVAKLIQPLEPLKCFDFSDTKKYISFTDCAKVNGMHYAIGRGQGLDAGFQYNYMMFYNAKALINAGVSPDMMPNKLEASGNWTWANWQLIASKLKQAGYNAADDAQGMGSPGSTAQNSIFKAMMLSNGTDIIKRDANGNFTFSGSDPKFQQAIDLYKTCVQNKYISTSYGADFSAGVSADSHNGVFAVGPQYMSKWGYGRSSIQEVKDYYDEVYLPKWKASDAYTVIADGPASSYHCIPYGVKNPAEVATVLQAINPWETDSTVCQAENMMDYSQYVSSNYADHQIALMTKLNQIAFSSSQKYYYDAFAGGPGVWKDFYTHLFKIANGSENAASVIAANSAKYNSLLKNVFTIR